MGANVLKSVLIVWKQQDPWIEGKTDGYVLVTRVPENNSNFFWKQKILCRLSYWYLTLQPLQNQLRTLGFFVSDVQEKWNHNKHRSQAILSCSSSDMTFWQTSQNHSLSCFSFRTPNTANQPSLLKYVRTRWTSTLLVSLMVSGSYQMDVALYILAIQHPLAT